MKNPDASWAGDATRAALTDLERQAEETTWGRYLGDIEERGILRAEALAERPGRTIDIGCGGGRWSKLLADRGWDVTSTDIDRDALAVCQRKVPSAKCLLVESSDHRIPVASGSLQLVLCMEVPHVVEAGWLPHEVDRVLSANGIVVGVQFNLHSWRGAVWNVKRPFKESDGSYTISYARWRRRWRRQGFAMLHEEAFSWGPCKRNGNSRFVPGVVKAERALGLDRVVRWGPWVLFVARKTSNSGTL